MRRIFSSNWFLLACILAALAVLVSLGNWQMRRLAWKEGLIAEISSRMESPAMSLSEIEAKWTKSADVDYFPLTLSGTFDHAHEALFYNTLDGQVGWHVITPLMLADGRAILVDRGFVPDQLRDPKDRKDGQISGIVQVTGLARNPVLTKPNSMIPDNSIEKNEFYWKDFAAIANRAGLSTPNKLLPFMADAGKGDHAYAWPKGGVTLVTFNNSHLQYAVTWYGLGATLVLVGGGFMWSRRKTSKDNTADKV